MVKSLTYTVLIICTLAALGRSCGATPPTVTSNSSVSPAVSISGPGQIRARESTAFKASVRGIRSDSVLWSVNGIVGGNAKIGTISPSGFYIAPNTTTTVTIDCASVLIPSVRSSITLSIVNPVPRVSSASLLSFNDAGFVIDVRGSGFVPQSLVSVNEAFVSTSFLSSTELHATVTQSLAGGSSVKIEASNPDPGAATSIGYRLVLPPTSLYPLTGCSNPYSTSPSPNVGLETSSDDWGVASDNALYFPIDVSNTLLIGTPVYTSNTIFWVSREAQPGDSILMSGAFTSNRKTAKVALIPPGTLDWQSVVRRSGVKVSTTQQGTTGLSFIVPKGLRKGVYGFEIDDPSAPPIFSLANDPSISWVMGVPSSTNPATAFQAQIHGCGVEPGETLRIFGKNIVKGDQVVLQDPNGVIKVINPLESDTNSMIAKIPESLASGTYHLWLGSAPWSATSSQPSLLTVISATPVTATTVQCSTLVGDGNTDNADLLQSCADSNAPKSAPNQIVYLAMSNGTFRMSHGVTLHSGEILLGSGASSSQILGNQPDSQLQPLFTLSQYSGIADLTIMAPGISNLIRTSDLSGNPATSGHVFLARLVLDSTPGDSTSSAPRMLALSGPDVQIYDSTVFSGTHFGLDVQQSDGIVISGNTFINDYGFNTVESSQNTIFERNTAYSKMGTGNPGGAAISLARPFCVECQSMVTRNEYVGYNTIHDMGSNIEQMILVDGGAGAYYGPIESSTAATVVLANDPSWEMTGTGDPQGLSLSIILGTGAGQQSFLKSVSGRTMTLATPWKVVPDSTSIVVIAASEQNLIIANNTITDTGGTAMLVYRAIDAIVEDNNITNSAIGIMLDAFGNYGGAAAYPPLMNIDVLRNNILAGSGSLVLTAPLRNISGIGIFDGMGTIISGMMVRGNTVSPLQTIFSTNGQMGISANVIERNVAYWVDPPGTVPGFLVQNNVNP